MALANIAILRADNSSQYQLSSQTWARSARHSLRPQTNIVVVFCTCCPKENLSPQTSRFLPQTQLFLPQNCLKQLPHPRLAGLLLRTKILRSDQSVPLLLKLSGPIKSMISCNPRTSNGIRSLDVKNAPIIMSSTQHIKT